MERPKNVAAPSPCNGVLETCKAASTRSTREEVGSEKWLLPYESDHGKSWIKLFVSCAGRKLRKYLARDTASAADADADAEFILFLLILLVLVRRGVLGKHLGPEVERSEINGWLALCSPFSEDSPFLFLQGSASVGKPAPRLRLADSKSKTQNRQPRCFRFMTSVRLPIASEADRCLYWLPWRKQA